MIRDAAGVSLAGPLGQALREALERRRRLTFAAFMELVLHGPGGYYATHPVVTGPEGDFITSPELHPALGACVGLQALAVWQALGEPDRFDLVEYGGGSGALARDLLVWAREAEPRCFAALRYRIVERSPALVQQQRAVLASAGLEATVGWAEASALDAALPLFDGLAIAHELLDALPFHLVTPGPEGLRELYVVEREGRLALEPGPPSTPALEAYFARLGLAPGEGTRAEVCLLVERWLAQVSSALRRGAALVIDYGAEAERLLAPGRPRGTLRCYYRHTVNDEPLTRVGQQDITADVDFTTLRLLAARLGLDAWGPLAQSEVLARLGLAQAASAVGRAAIPWAEREANLRALQALVDPDGLGRIGWLLLTRGLASFTPFQPAGAPRWERVPLLWPGQARLPGPEALEGLPDFAEQWRELWGGEPDETEAGSSRADSPE